MNDSDLGEIPASPAPWVRLVAGWFFVGTLVGGVGLAAVTISALELPTTESYLDGIWTSAFEDSLEEALPVREAAIAAWGWVDYFGFGDGRPGVLVGEHGWLYTTEEFAWPEGGAVEVSAKLARVQELSDRLADKGISLVVALIPAKRRVAAEHLGSLGVPERHDRLYADFLRGLQDAGISAPDLAAPLSGSDEQLFLRTDTHWTPRGAEVVARAVGTAVESARLFPELDAVPHTRKHTGTISHKGDLLSFLPLGPLQDRGPQQDELATFETSSSGGGLGLLDEAAPPVALVGTSYSAKADWGFAEALEVALGADVLNVAMEGKGPIVPMYRYLENQAFEQTPPKLVIWEIPERYLPVRYDLSDFETAG